jgi:thiol-disulfide isomerase/thioredoxin
MNFNHVLGLVSSIGLSMACLNVHADTTGQQLAEGAGSPLIGTLAPRLVLKTIDGKTIDLGRLYGRQAVYLKFWATWCVPCREQMPHFEHVYETAAADLVVIAINSGFNDSVDDVRTYRRKLGITMPIVLDDGHAGAAFNLRVTPQHIVIGRDGRIQYVGHLADARLDAALVAARTAPIASAADAATGSDSPAAIVRFKVGDHLPQQSPLTIDGTAFAFRDPGISTGHTILVFLSPWCESYLATTRPEASINCRRMREQVTALASERGARWLGIASGLWATPDDLRQYRTNFHVDIPLTLDESGALFRSFNVRQVPTALIADASGRIVRRVEAAELESPTMMRTAIRSP